MTKRADALAAASMPPRTVRSVMRRIIKPDPDDPAPLGNAWPGGARSIACLGCAREFPSAGRQERMCPACRKHAQ